MQLGVGEGGGDAANGWGVLGHTNGVGVEGNNPRCGGAFADEGCFAVSSGRCFNELFQLEQGEIHRFLFGGLGVPQGQHGRAPIDVEARRDGGVEAVAEFERFSSEVRTLAEPLGEGVPKLGVFLDFPEGPQGGYGTTGRPRVGFRVEERHSIFANGELREGLWADGALEFGAIVFFPVRIFRERREDFEGKQHAGDVVEVVTGKTSARSERFFGWHSPEVGDDGLDGVGEASGDFVSFVSGGDVGVEVLPKTENPRQGLIVGTHWEMGVSVGTDASGNEAFHFAHGVEADEAAHEFTGFVGIVWGTGDLPAVEGCVEVEAGEHCAVLCGLEPAERVGFPCTTLRRGGERDFSVESGEVQENAVSIDESGPDFNMSRLRLSGCGAGVGANAEERHQQRHEREEGFCGVKHPIR